MTEPYCALCRRTVTYDGDHIEATVVTDPKEKPHGTTYYFHQSCWFEAEPIADWGGPA